MFFHLHTLDNLTQQSTVESQQQNCSSKLNPHSAVGIFLLESKGFLQWHQNSDDVLGSCNEAPMSCSQRTMGTVKKDKVRFETLIGISDNIYCTRAYSWVQFTDGGGKDYNTDELLTCWIHIHSTLVPYYLITSQTFWLCNWTVIALLLITLGNISISSPPITGKVNITQSITLRNA